MTSRATQPTKRAVKSALVRATCAICGNRVAIKRDGLLRSHVGWRGSVYVGRGRGVRCEGRLAIAWAEEQ